MPTLLLFLRMVIALAIVLGLVLVATRVMARGRGRLGAARRPGSSFGLVPLPPGRGGGRPGGSLLGSIGLGARPGEVPLELLCRRALNRGSALVVVRVGERVLLLGTTAQSVQLLAELSSPELGIVPAGAGESVNAASPAATELDGIVPGRVERALAGHATPDGTPWTALQDADSTTAWDAFLASLRERTVRR